MLSFKLTRSLSTQANHFNKPFNCYYDTITRLKQLCCIIDEEGVNVFVLKKS